ncbi:FtsQ-type POTRA domain-containing protein [Microbacterium sp. ARD32]|uniref:FtsQ-type POTRA domain-containing protein n=1 Tax=Microbacterium sp. ARD32 TaxID=2962577 RepID=UPI00288197B7|nr:FtsQ-type POTRA domain-containing protein [Microbacterium sp. ARD32]MDT0157531.1 FtsQ-type POTRA domain-containing protein [Microbacterium sp. ARD32]
MAPGETVRDETAREEAAHEEMVTPARVPLMADAAASATAESVATEQESRDAGDQAPVRSSDVWRAARARRKALRAEIRRFTQRSRRRRILWLSAIGAVVALLIGSALAAYGPLFAVERITVVGAKSLDAAAVQKALQGQLGSPLALIDDRGVKSALTEFPIIESYSLEARPPHELLVRIVERTPVGVLRSDAGYTLVDAAGVVLSTTPDPPAGQPVLKISGGADTAAFRSAGLVVRSLSADLRAQVTQVSASTVDDVTLTLKDGPTVLWGSDDDSVTKALVLAALIKSNPDARGFDVSAPTVPVVR